MIKITDTKHKKKFPIKRKATNIIIRYITNTISYQKSNITRHEFNAKLKEIIQKDISAMTKEQLLSNFNESMKVVQKHNTFVEPIHNFDCYTVDNYFALQRELVSACASGRISKKEFQFLFEVNSKNKSAWEDLQCTKFNKT